MNICADILTFGLPEKCQKCSVGDLVFSKYGYACNGWIDEWVKCGNFETKPKRTNYTVPDDLRGNKYFKMFKPQIEDRVLRLKCTDDSHSEETCATASSEPQRNQKNEIVIQLKQGAAVDLEFDLCCSTQVHRNIHVLYSCVLVLVDIEQNKNSFFIMQVNEYDDVDHRRLLMMSKIPSFYLFTRWGRIGTNIGNSKIQTFQSVDLAIDEFEKVFKEETGNNWKLRNEFVKISGKLFNIDVNYELCTYDSEFLKYSQIFELFKLIIPGNIVRTQMLDFKLDLHRMPLGKLSSLQLQKAQETLFLIEKAIEAESSKSVLIGLSNKFFTMVPQNFESSTAPILDSITKISQQKNMLESLFKIEKDYLGVMTRNTLKLLNADIEVLEQDSEIYNLIETYIKNTSVQGFKLNVIEIFKVQRHEEVESYAPFKNFTNRQLLWHGSRIENFASIIRNGLKISNRKNLFGHGIYFADIASKSANYCKNDQGIGILALCEVALGNIFELDGFRGLNHLPSNFDSVKALGKFHPDIAQAHTTDDGVLIPLGEVNVGYNRNVFNKMLLYNEYIVYNESQIKLKYLVKFKNNS